MHGSFRFRLFAVSFLILTSSMFLGGQANRPNRASGLGTSLALTGWSSTPPSSLTASPEMNSPPVRVPAPIQLPPGTIGGLFQISRAAGTIFSGRVTAISKVSASSNRAVATVAITFRVEHAIRGSSPGENLTISQWIGLWTGGQRYRIGERVLLFLYPPSKLGLTSSVAGPMGRFNIDALGRILFSEQHVTAFHDDPILSGKSSASLRDFSRAVLRSGGQQ